LDATWPKRVHSSETADLVSIGGRDENAFVSAIEQAFYGHYPLELSPDMIQLQIIGGISSHLNANPEKLGNLVKDLKAETHLKIFDERLDLRSPVSVWEKNLLLFEKEISDRIKVDLPIFRHQFSTSTMTSRVAVAGGMMSAFKEYFTYGMMGGCGIPSIRLHGTPEDWDRLLELIKFPPELDLDWWSTELRPVLEQFARAARGSVDPGFWRFVVRKDGGSGSDPVIQGWLSVFLPYLYGIDSDSAEDTSTNSETRPEGSIAIELCPVIGRGKTVYLKPDDPVERLVELAPPRMKRLIVGGKSLTEGTLKEYGLVEGTKVYCVHGAKQKLVRNWNMSAWHTGHSVGRSRVPPAFNFVPLTFETLLEPGVVHQMTLGAGFIGVAQNPETLAIYPKIGWVLLSDPSKEKETATSPAA
jgi:hypothetical protein